MIRRICQVIAVLLFLVSGVFLVGLIGNMQHSRTISQKVVGLLFVGIPAILGWGAWRLGSRRRSTP